MPNYDLSHFDGRGNRLNLIPQKLALMETEDIVWKSEYSVGIDTVDEQHQRFLAIINELGLCIAHKTYKEKGNNIFFSLVHFSDTYLMKEKMLVNSIPEIDYSYFREKHKQFLNRVKLFKEEFFLMPREELFLDLYQYLKEMYPQYISYYTPSLISILKKNGVE